MPARRTTFVLAWAGLGLALALAAALYLVPALGINRLSLRYLADLGQGALAPPEGHPRAAYWGALRALDEGDGQLAVETLELLAVEGDSLVQQTLGRAYEASGDLRAAMGIWERMGNEYALLEMGESATQARDLETAQEAYARAWVVDPGGHSTARLAGFLWGQKGDPGAAEEVLRWSLANCPSCSKRPYWYRQLAELLEAEGRWAEAAEARQGVIQTAHLMIIRNRQEDAFYSNLAWAYHMSGQTEAALAAIDEALSLSESHPKEAILNRAGQIYEAAGEREKALGAYRQVLALDPADADARAAVARLAGE